MATDETRARLAALAERVAQSPKRGRWLVLTHDNPDPDALASTAALALILRRHFHRHVMVAYGERYARYIEMPDAAGAAPRDEAVA